LKIDDDYVTGGLELARRAGAAYVLAAADDVAYDHTGARDGDDFTVADLVVRAVHTPGHTSTHLSYVVVEDGQSVAAFAAASTPGNGSSTCGRARLSPSATSPVLSSWRWATSSATYLGWVLRRENR